MLELNIKRPMQKPDLHIETDDMKLFETLRSIYLPFLTHTDNLEDAYNIKFYKDGNHYVFEAQDKHIIDYSEALQAIENIVYESTVIDKTVLAIHSATVAYNNKAFIFAGFTESGKSTLTAYLCNKGFEYLSDDVALIKACDLKLLPYPRPMQLRDGGIDVLKRCGVSFNNCVEVDFGKIKRTVVNWASPKYQEYDIGGIFFIQRTENVNSLDVESKQNAFLKLIKSLLISSQMNASKLDVIKNLCQFGKYNLQYCDMDYVERLIKHGVFIM